MIEAGRITGEALLVAREHVREGVSTKELDTLIRRHIEKCGAKPSFLVIADFPGQRASASTTRSSTAYLLKRRYCARETSLR
jgi:methionine aminopeptidase